MIMNGKGLAIASFLDVHKKKTKDPRQVQVAKGHKNRSAVSLPYPESLVDMLCDADQAAAKDYVAEMRERITITQMAWMHADILSKHKEAYRWN